MLFWGLSDQRKSRSKRFVYNANSTCGFIAFCDSDIHQYDLALNGPLADNPSCSKPGIMISIVFNILVAIFIVFGNFMIVYIMSTKRKFKNPQGVFKTTLAIFDFLVGAAIMPVTIYNKITILLYPLHQSYLQYFRQFEHSSTSIVFGMLFSICMTGSLFSLLALTIDRLMAVYWPFKYMQNKLMTRGKAVAIVVAIWLLSVMLGVLAIGDETRFHYDLGYMTMNYMLEVKINRSRKPPDLRHGIFFLVLIFIIPYVCVVGVTATTWFLLWRTQSAAKKEKTKSMAAAPQVALNVIPENSEDTVQSNIDSPENPDKELPMTTVNLKVKTTKASKSGHKKKKGRIKKSDDSKDLEKLTIIMVIMVASFTVCVLPFLAVQTYNITPFPDELAYIKKYGERFAEKCNPVLHLLVVELLFLNSLCNFIIYNLRNETFKKEMQKALKAIAKPFTRDWR